MRRWKGLAWKWALGSLASVVLVLLALQWANAAILHEISCSITVDPLGDDIVAVGDEIYLNGSGKRGEATPREEQKVGKPIWGISCALQYRAKSTAEWGPPPEGCYEVKWAGGQGADPSWNMKAKFKAAGYWNILLNGGVGIPTDPGTDESWTGRAPEKSIEVTVVGIQKLQYSMNDGSEPFQDVTDTLYAIKDKSIKFKAFPIPADASWPSGKPEWSGTSGASGSGETMSPEFPTPSTTRDDMKTVIAKCGTSTATANVVVCEVEGILSGDWVENHSKSDFGILEQISLSSRISPKNVTANDLGGLEWSCGDRILTGDAKDGTGFYECQSKPGHENFKLKRLFTKSKVVVDEKDINIIAPNGIELIHEFTYEPGIRHTKGTAGAGVCHRIRLKPFDVSFGRLYVRSAEAKMCADGYWGLGDEVEPGPVPLDGMEFSKGGILKVILGNGVSNIVDIYWVQNNTPDFIVQPFTDGTAHVSFEFHYYAKGNPGTDSKDEDWVYFTNVDLDWNISGYPQDPKDWNYYGVVGVGDSSGGYSRWVDSKTTNIFGQEF